MFVLFIFLTVITVSASAEKYICTVNHTVEMQSDTVMFFESPDFPRYMTAEEKDQCYISFTKTLSVEEQNKRFVIVTSNALCGEYTDCKHVFESSSNSNSYEFNLNDEVYQHYEAFQGFVYFDDWSDDCPLESVARVNPFHFTNLNQVLVIRSTYDQSKLRNQSCLWQFKAPDNYGFKIVVTVLSISNSTFFKVENNQDTIITLENARISHPHYSIDNFLKVYLSPNNNSFVPTENPIELEAYITIIQDFYNNIPFECISWDPSTWSYWNDEGYPSNSRCTHTLTIMPQTEVIATLAQCVMEDNVDMINYYYYNNNGRIDSCGMVFSTEDDKEEREVLWEFISDGSVQLKGFAISFETKYCNCATPQILVPCVGYAITNIMDGAEEFYCGNLECNFTIKQDSTCKSDFIVMHTVNLNLEETYDVFRIISNNVAIFDINRVFAPGNLHEFLIPAANANILQAITALSTNVRGLTLSFYKQNISTTLATVILTKTKPYYFHQHCVYNDQFPYMITIELSPNLREKNMTIEISIFDLNDIELLTFYNGNTLSEQLNLQNRFVNVTDNLFKCKTNVTSLSMVANEKRCFTTYLLYQITDGEKLIGLEGCVFKQNNVYNLDIGKSSYSAMSNGIKKCRIFFFSSYDICIPNMWISPYSNGSINIFSGVEEKSYIDIDTNSLFLWRHICLSKNIYAFDIPLNSALLLTFPEYDVTVNITNNPYKTIITSPNYGDNAIIAYPQFDNHCDGTRATRTFNIFKTTVNFTVLDFDVLEPNYFFLRINKTKYITINSTSTSFTFGPSHIEFGCLCTSNIHCNIRILVETINMNNGPLITTTTTLSTTKHLQITTEKSVSLITT